MTEQAPAPQTAPPTLLERTLQGVREGEVPIATLVEELTRTELLVPSGRAPGPDGSGLQPIVFDKEGTPMVACFTLPERIGAMASLAPHTLPMRGSDLLHLIPRGHGLVINPRHDLWFDLSPEGVALAVAEMS